MDLYIAICDDEQLITEDLRTRLLEYGPDFQIDIYHSGVELLKNYDRYDILFLDIEMPGRNGMDIAHELQEEDYEGDLVFLTNHEEYMKDAFKVDAFRFLKKPIDNNDLEEAINASTKRIQNHRKILVVQSTAGTKSVRLKDLIYLKTVRNSTYLHTKDGCIETRKSMREWMELLGTEGFIQVHKSYGVALRHIDTIGRDYVIMRQNKTKIPVSRRKITDLKEAYAEYVKIQAFFV